MSDTANVHDYEQEDMMKKLQAALKAAGLADKQLTPADLAPLDQFHSRGFEATRELAEALRLTPDTKVLDVGSGLGGPARYLATKYGCHVLGIDLTQSYVDAARYLAKQSGLAEKVTFSQANALALPFTDQRFDLVWTQHVAMNIKDRPKLYSEMYRVLKPGGQLAIYDVVAGANGPVHFPVPWSTSPDTSYLMTPEAMRALLEQLGFEVVSWEDRTAAGIEWFDKLQKSMAQKASQPVDSAAEIKPTLGLNIAVGPDFPARAANLGRSMQEGRAGLIETILIRN